MGVCIRWWILSRILLVSVSVHATLSGVIHLASPQHSTGTLLDTMLVATAPHHHLQRLHRNDRFNLDAHHWPLSAPKQVRLAAPRGKEVGVTMADACVAREVGVQQVRGEAHVKASQGAALAAVEQHLELEQTLAERAAFGQR
jgi:hypothetical protein